MATDPMQYPAPIDPGVPDMMALPLSDDLGMPSDDVSMPEPEPQYGAAKARLVAWAEEINLAEQMAEEELTRIGQQVVDDYEIDEESRKEWLERNQDAIRLANQIKEEKSFPWQGAANVKIPVIADAAIKFAARAYAEIIRDDKIVKGKVIGPDPTGEKDQRAQRVGTFMSWQLTESMEEWEEDTDKLLHVLPVVGHVFRKVYYCPSRRRNVSQLVMPQDFCVNNTASNLQSARRATHILRHVPRNVVIENQRAGAWLDVDLDRDLTTAFVEGEPETSKYYDFLEQHTWLDLDDDGYEEPYVVTVEKDSRKVVRIVARYEADDIQETPSGKIARIEPCLYFADYKFIPSFDGGYYHVGFGTLLLPLNETANTLFNQLLDAGTLSNLGGGFLSKEIKVKSGVYRFTPHEWKKTEANAEQLAKGIHPLPVREPSPTLFSLLGLVLDLTRDLASVKDVLAGDTPGANVPATTVMALIEQGLKTYNAIYKRVYRSLKSEFRVLFRLNARYLDEEEYFRVLDQDARVYRADFNREDCDVIPVADPYLSSDVQRMARAQALQETIGMPGVNPMPILRYKFEAMRVDPALIEEILTVPEQGPSPEAMKLEQQAQFKLAEAQLKERELELREREAELKAQEMEARIVNLLSQAVKNFADAEAAEAGQQLQAYQAEIGTLLQTIKLGQSARHAALTERQAQQQAQQPGEQISQQP